MSDLTAGAIDKIVELTKAASADPLVALEGKMYSRIQLHDPVAPEPLEETLQVRTLSSFVDFVTERVKDGFVHVVSPRLVNMIGNMNVDRVRPTYATAKYAQPWNEGTWDDWRSCEDAVIGLQATCEDTPERARLLHLLGTVKDEHISTAQDDGVTQSVQVKSGVSGALSEGMVLQNPFTISPYLMFPEAGLQIPIPHVCRMRRSTNGVQVKLLQADGGAWEAVATAFVAEHLRVSLPETMKVFA